MAAGSSAVPEPCKDDEPKSVEDVMALTIDWQSTLQTPGLLHILHNASLELCKVLQQMPTWLDDLKLVANTLRRHGDRVAETCCKQDDRAYQVIQSFAAEVYEARWGAVARAVVEVVRAEPFLRKHWSQASFSFHKSIPTDNGGDDDSHRIKIAQLDRVVKSEFFWRYAEMVSHIAVTLRRLEVWAEGCPCHYTVERVMSLPLESATATHDAEPSNLLAKCCPLRGKRSADLAQGRIFALLEALVQESSAKLALRCSVLPPEELNTVMADFALARTHLHFTLTIKLAFWRELPFAMAVLADTNKQSSQLGIARCMTMYDSMDDAELLQNPLSVWAMSPDGQVREQLQAYCVGTHELEDLPEALTLASRFKYMPCVERFVEGLHARVNRYSRIAPHFGPCHVAWQFAQETLVKNFELGGQEFAEELAEACKAVANIRSAVTSFGFGRHPVMRRLIGEFGAEHLVSKARSEMLNLMYHTDAHTLYQDLKVPNLPGFGRIHVSCIPLNLPQALRRRSQFFTRCFFWLKKDLLCVCLGLVLCSRINAPTHHMSSLWVNSGFSQQ